MTSSSSRAEGEQRPCILLVDDTPANIDVLVDLLKGEYDLKIATRGEKALEICQRDEPLDLVLLDIMMPGMDGFEVCKQLRSQPKTRELPVLFLTAKTEVSDVVRGFQSGGNDYLTKPFRPEELLARVGTQMTLRRQRFEIEEKNNRLKELLQIVCHDVANHFSVLDMGFELAESSPGFDLNHFLPHMKAAVKNGVNLTKMVREMRRSEDKVLKMEPVGLKAALEEAMLLLYGKIQDKQLKVTLEVPRIAVLGETYGLVNTVFGNILTNAIKFSYPGATISVDAHEEGDMVCVRIRDHGIGMPAPALEQIFDMGLCRSRQGTGGETGTGFGMPLMHRFVKKFGGRVEVSSREEVASPADHGTEFRVWLRRAMVAPSAARPLVDLEFEHPVG